MAIPHSADLAEPAPLPAHLRIAVVGKGGVGKTVLSSLLIRAFREQGRKVLAVDLDPSPGLQLSLGLEVDDLPFPEEAIEARPELPYGWGLASHLRGLEAVTRCALEVAPGLLYMGFGNISSGNSEARRFVSPVRQAMEGFNEPGWVTIMDLEAGPTTPFEGFARYADIALLVAEAFPSSIAAAHRLLSIMRHHATPAGVVVSRARSEADSATITRVFLEPIASLPFDPEIRRLERTGSLQDLADDSPTLAAVRALAARIAAWVAGGKAGASSAAEMALELRSEVQTK